MKVPKLLALRACYELARETYLHFWFGYDGHDVWGYREAEDFMRECGALDQRPWAVRAAEAWAISNGEMK